jgi:hypothetical protein
MTPTGPRRTHGECQNWICPVIFKNLTRIILIIPRQIWIDPRNKMRKTKRKLEMSTFHWSAKTHYSKSELSNCRMN